MTNFVDPDEILIFSEFSSGSAMYEILTTSNSVDPDEISVFSEYSPGSKCKKLGYHYHNFSKHFLIFMDDSMI